MRSATWLVIGGLLTVAACSNELKGDVKVEHKGQAWTVTPDGCVSGQRHGFFGADLQQTGKDDAQVRVIEDPRNGYALRLGVPGGDSVIVDRSVGCKQLELHVERQNSTINNVANVRGHLRVDCELPDIKVHADVTFANCH